MNAIAIFQPKPAAQPQDPTLGLVTAPEEAASERGFEKVLKETSGKPREEDSKAAKEKDERDERKAAKAKKVGEEELAAMASKGKQNLPSIKLAAAKPKDAGNPAKVAEAKPKDAGNTVKGAEATMTLADSTQAAVKAKKKSTGEQSKAEAQARKTAEPKTQTETSNEQAAAAALKKARVRKQVELKHKQQAAQETKVSDNKQDQKLRARNSGYTPQMPTAKPVSTAKTAEAKAPEPGNGTQVAVNEGRMVMQAKQPAAQSASDASRPASVEELRPATSAELAGQGGQQDGLPREQAKDQPIVAVTQVAATGAPSNGAVQTFTPAAGIITPMLEKIWNAVSTFRARGGDEVVVKLQPDNRTEVQLTIKYGKAGVEIQARMQQGDGSQLAAGWNELQQSLADRGVTLANLEQDENIDLNFEQHAQKHAKNGEKHEKEAEINIGDDTADWSALGLKSPEKETPKEQREAVLPTHDGWQSWA